MDDYCPVSLNGDMYDTTIRTIKCELLVNSAKCEACKQYRSTAKKHIELKGEVRYHHTNYRYLKTPEQKERMSTLKAELDHSKREIDRLKTKIKNLQGVCKGRHLEPCVVSSNPETRSSITMAILFLTYGETTSIFFPFGWCST